MACNLTTHAMATKVKATLTKAWPSGGKIYRPSVHLPMLWYCVYVTFYVAFPSWLPPVYYRTCAKLQSEMRKASEFATFFFSWTPIAAIKRAWRLSLWSTSDGGNQTGLCLAWGVGLNVWWCGGVQSVVVWLVISGQCWQASSGLAVSGRSGEEVSNQLKVTLLSSRYVMFLEICSLLVWSCFGIMTIASVFCKKTWCWKKQIERMVDTKTTWEEKATATVMWRNCVKRLELVRRAKLYRGSGNGAQRLCGVCKGWHHMLKEEVRATTSMQRTCLVALGRKQCR